MLGIGAFRVEDTSMLPALRPGDRLLVTSWLGPRIGDVVVIRDPESPSSFLIKRVSQLHPNGDVTLSGDNLNVSRDSRVFGAVPRSLVVGRVFYRYLPHDRRGGL